MLENEFGRRLSGFPNGTHWLLFKELPREPSLWEPLRAVVHSHVTAALVTYGAGGPGHQSTIDSTAAGPAVFSQLAAGWEVSYQQWHADLRHRKPEIDKDVEPRQVAGMAFWHVLAEFRPDERWLAPQYKKATKLYKVVEVLRRATA